MSRRLGSIDVVITIALVAATLVHASCKREERIFRVLPARAKATRAPSNTPIHAAGTNSAPTTMEYPSPPLADFESQADALAQGNWLYEAMNCAGCHGAHGGGGIGPALSDDEWIYGWREDVIFDSILHGRPGGMPSFDGKISDHQIWQLVAYVRSLSGLASSQAAPGRSDHMSGAIPPNSIQPATPRSSISELEELHRQDQNIFERLKWLDPRTNKARVPESVMQGLKHRSVPATATRPTTAPSGAERDANKINVRLGNPSATSEPARQ